MKPPLFVVVIFAISSVSFSQNVGIGTTTPSARLHVSTSASEVIRMQGEHPFLSLNDNIDGQKGYLWYNGVDIILGSTTSAIRFASNGFRMSINTDGRVTIGSSNSPATGYLLSVAGKIISEEIKVQLSGDWPDYVFADNYQLMSIDDLEKSIRQNRHLPNIPAAAVLEKEGFHLGDMNKRLIEKVEELTLYIIELSNKNKQLEERLNKVEQASVYKQ